MKTHRDIKGDGGSQVLEQIVAQREQIAERFSPIKHLLAVGSGKGGVGKSTLCMQLACAYRAQGKKVAVLDADLNGPSTAQIAGLHAPPLVPGESGLLVPSTEEGIAVLSTGLLLEPEHALSFDSVLQGDSFTWRATKEFSTLASLLAGVEWGERDVLLIDLPPGAERTLQFAQFFGPRLQLLLTSIPTDLSLGVVLRGVHALEQHGINVLGYVENMSGYLSPESGTVQPLFPARSGGKQPSIQKLGSLPFDPKIASLCDTGMSVEQWRNSPSAALVQPLAEDLWNAVEAAKRGEK